MIPTVLFIAEGEMIRNNFRTPGSRAIPVIDTTIPATAAAKALGRIAGWQQELG